MSRGNEDQEMASALEFAHHELEVREQEIIELIQVRDNLLQEKSKAESMLHEKVAEVQGLEKKLVDANDQIKTLKIHINDVSLELSASRAQIRNLESNSGASTGSSFTVDKEPTVYTQTLDPRIGSDSSSAAVEVGVANGKQLVHAAVPNPHIRSDSSSAMSEAVVDDGNTLVEATAPAGPTCVEVLNPLPSLRSLTEQKVVIESSGLNSGSTANRNDSDDDVDADGKSEKFGRVFVGHNCQVCKKKFSTLNDLRKHTRVHTGEKPYQCETCNKAFTQNVSLMEHQRSHTGEKPYLCALCVKSFTSSSGLPKHKKSKGHLRLQSPAEDHSDQ